MPFVQIDVSEEIEKKKNESEEFCKKWDKRRNQITTVYELKKARREIRYRDRREISTGCCLY